MNYVVDTLRIGLVLYFVKVERSFKEVQGRVH